MRPSVSTAARGCRRQVEAGRRVGPLRALIVERGRASATRVGRRSSSASRAHLTRRRRPWFSCRMPLQNRVTPFGELVAHPGRGLVYGNRGCLHDDGGRIRRRYNGKRADRLPARVPRLAPSAAAAAGQVQSSSSSTRRRRSRPATGRARSAGARTPCSARSGRSSAGPGRSGRDRCAAAPGAPRRGSPVTLMSRICQTASSCCSQASRGSFEARPCDAGWRATPRRDRARTRRRHWSRQVTDRSPSRGVEGAVPFLHPTAS